MMQLERAFQILGISPASDAAAIRTAWRALVRSYHPDMSKEDPQGANDRLAEINAAFDAVSSCTAADRKALAAATATRARRAAWARRFARAAVYEAKRAKRDTVGRGADAGSSKRHEAQSAAASRRTSALKTSTRLRRMRQCSARARLQSRAQAGFAEAARILARPAPSPLRSIYL